MLQVAIAVLHLSRLHVRSEVLSILVASQCLLLWLKIQYFARCAAGFSPHCFALTCHSYLLPGHHCEVSLVHSWCTYASLLFLMCHSYAPSRDQCETSSGHLYMVHSFVLQV